MVELNNNFTVFSRVLCVGFLVAIKPVAATAGTCRMKPNISTDVTKDFRVVCTQKCTYVNKSSM